MVEVDCKLTKCGYCGYLTKTRIIKIDGSVRYKCYRCDSLKTMGEEK